MTAASDPQPGEPVASEWADDTLADVERENTLDERMKMQATTDEIVIQGMK